jgi:hypothetical protein
MHLFAHSRAKYLLTALINFISLIMSAAASELHIVLMRIHGVGLNVATPHGNLENLDKKAKHGHLNSR